MMLSIPIETQGYTSTQLRRLAKAAALSCSWADVCRAAATVGRKDRQAVFQHGRYSYLEMWYRVLMLAANLQQTAGSPALIESSAAFRGLESSEKGAISYFLGLTMAKLTAEQFLDVTCLMHLRTYQHLLKPQVGDVAAAGLGRL